MLSTCSSLNILRLCFVNDCTVRVAASNSRQLIWRVVVMHQYQFSLTDLIPMLFSLKMADTCSIPILWYTALFKRNIQHAT